MSGFVPSVTPVASGSRPRAVCAGTSAFFGTWVAQRATIPMRAKRSARSERDIRMDVGDQDYYSVLGVQRDASEKDLKSAYRQMARKYHPDVNPSENAKEKFQECTRAYEVLSDPEKRRMYDQFGEAGVSGAAGAGATGFGDFVDFGGVQDVFETFFGGGGGARSRTRRQTGPVRGEDLRLDVEVDFKRAVFGGEQKIRFSHLESCKKCKGTGVKPGTKPRTCGTCGGSGYVVTVARTPLGAFQQQSTCADCRGTGEIVDEYCGSCGGRGRTQTSKQVVLTIPAGVDSGSRLRVRGEGDAGLRGGPSGDLFVVLKVKRDPKFRRDGLTIYTDLGISYIDAILGKEAPVETIDGEVMLTIPPGSQPGKELRITGKGIPKLGSPTIRGDHVVTIVVKIPTKVSASEKSLLEELRHANHKDDSKKDGGFFPNPFGKKDK